MTHSDILPASRPVLCDVRSCDEWLSRAALTDSRQACSAFLALLDDLEDAPPRHAIYLQILERLREPVLIAQEENARKFTAKPLPLGHTESAAFGQANDLWIVLLRAYRRLLRAALKGGKPELTDSVPVLCKRTIEYSGELIVAHFLARREVGEDLWRGLNEAYALAEQRQVADVAVAEARSRMPSPSTCKAAYVRPLMLALAHPYGLRERELTWARRWTHRWSGKAALSAGAGEQRGYRVDPRGTAGPAWQDGSPASDSARLLEFTAVARSIKWRLQKLEEGATPAELGLGRNCVQPATGALLAALLASWARAPKSREFPRHTARLPARLVSGIAQIHAALGGEVPAEEARQWNYARRDADQIHDFQRVADAGPRGTLAAASEPWETLDESAGGFRLLRRGPGARLAHCQLIALRPHGALQFILCEVRWLTQNNTDPSLTLGARALVGLAQPVAVRPVGEERARPDAFSHALVLPVARNLPASLVLPGGWYQSARALELRTGGEVLRVRLTELITRGHDFDQARFEVTA